MFRNVWMTMHRQQRSCLEWKGLMIDDGVSDETVASSMYCSCLLCALSLDRYKARQGAFHFKAVGSCFWASQFYWRWAKVKLWPWLWVGSSQWDTFRQLVLISIHRGQCTAVGGVGRRNTRQRRDLQKAGTYFSPDTFVLKIWPVSKWVRSRGKEQNKNNKIGICPIFNEIYFKTTAGLAVASDDLCTRMQWFDLDLNLLFWWPRRMSGTYVKILLWIPGIIFVTVLERTGG